MPAPDPPTSSYEVSPGATPGTLCMALRGAWTQASAMPSARMLLDAAARPGVTTLTFATQALGEWDSMLPLRVLELMALAAPRQLAVETAGLPGGVQTLVALATPAAPARTAAAEVPDTVVQRLGRETAALAGWFGEIVNFLGATLVALVRWVRGNARVRPNDVIMHIRDCGANALPIVSLVSVLVGVIFAFVGILQLRQFGVEIYVADLVAVIMIRVMGAVMVGIVLAGRTGSAFAAQLGTMQVNEEIDSLRVLGIPPMEFLVVPRVVALAVMMPLLCLYADFLGVCGGMVVGVNALHLNIVEYLQRTQAAVSFTDVLVGLVHSAVFGVLIAMAGCLCGMRCRRSAEAVGQAATAAVVMSIVSIIAATSLITAVCNVLGI
jgi:phospholipid/cholesterol/gamma-HCH transport system permease protein